MGLPEIRDETFGLLGQGVAIHPHVPCTNRTVLVRVAQVWPQQPVIAVAQRRCAVKNSTFPSGHRLSTEDNHENDIWESKLPLTVPFNLARGRHLLNHED